MSFYYANQGSMQPIESKEVLEQHKETFKWNLATYLSEYYVELVVNHGDIDNPDFREVRFLLHQWAQDCDDWFNKRRYEMECDWLEVDPWERALFQQQLKQLLEGIENGVHDKYLNHVVQEIIFEEMWEDSATRKIINTVRRGFGSTDLSDDEFTTELREWHQELLGANSNKEGADSKFPRNDVKAVSHISEAQNRGDDNGSSKKETYSNSTSDRDEEVGWEEISIEEYGRRVGRLTSKQFYLSPIMENWVNSLLSLEQLAVEVIVEAIETIKKDETASVNPQILLMNLEFDPGKQEKLKELLDKCKRLIKEVKIIIDRHKKIVEDISIYSDDTLSRASRFQENLPLQLVQGEHFTLEALLSYLINSDPPRPWNIGDLQSFLSFLEKFENFNAWEAN